MFEKLFLDSGLWVIVLVGVSLFLKTRKALKQSKNSVPQVMGEAFPTIKPIDNQRWEKTKNKEKKESKNNNRDIERKIYGKKIDFSISAPKEIIEENAGRNIKRDKILLKGKVSAKRAFLESEIFNRKYC